MSNFESDDLLLRSQMLISKFRKQREVALNQQVPHVNKLSNIKQYIPHRDVYYPKKIEKDCDSYPQREKDNVLINKFMSQHYFTHSMEESKLKAPKDYIHDSTENVELSSSSDSSIWSASSPTERGVMKKDCGVMTDRVQNINQNYEEVITPVTSLRQSQRASQERNRYTENELRTHTSPSKQFSSICTQFKTRTIGQNNVEKGQGETTDIFVEEQFPVVTDAYYRESNEEDKMKAAWEYFQEEKVLERQILQQTEFVNELNNDMGLLMSRIESESLKLNEMKTEKEGFRTRRYGIFNGLSREIQSNENEYDEGEKICHSSKSQPLNINSRGYLNDKNSEETDINNDDSFVSTLDSDTVRHIVNKIVSKEFCNSEDKIFDRILKNPRRTYYKEDFKPTIPQDIVDDCVLSDVLSVKDLKISSPSLDNTNKTSVNTTTSSISIFNNSSKRKPPKFKKRLKPAQSADNINQLMNDRDLKEKPRKNTRSPSISVDLKRYLYSSSSSDESIFESKIQTRR